jgi:hypothetical protein
LLQQLSCFSDGYRQQIEKMLATEKRLTWEPRESRASGLYFHHFLQPWPEEFQSVEEEDAPEQASGTPSI